jgi:hypothetical protein
MTSRQLLALFDSIYLLALAAMVGGLIFLTFVVAPLIFRVLGEEAGGRLVRALIPRYYLWNAILGAVALPAFVAGPLCFPEYRGPSVGVQSAVLLAMILSALYGGNSLVPQINQARDRGPASVDRFEQLHRRSVYLNGAVMFAGIGLIVAFACRPAPRTEGIIELTPIERARREVDAIRKGLGSPNGQPREAGRGAPSG